jgi:neutral amino acid transport system permease protein
MEDFIVSIIIFTAIYAVFALGLNLQWGFTGLINFGHVAFMTVGSYTTVLLSLAGVPLLFAALAGGLMAALLGLTIGVFTLRLRTDYLAVVTIGVAEMIRLIAVNEAWLTRGTFGIQGFPLPLSDLNPGSAGKVLMIALVTVVAGLAYWQGWQWFRRQVKGILFPDLLKAALTATGYLASLGLVLYTIGQGSQQLQRTELLPPWLISILFLAAIGGVAWGYVWLNGRAQKQVRKWGSGVTVVSTLAIALLGIWIYGYAALALYHYDRNPTKAGLMLVALLTLAIAFWGLQWLVLSPWGRVLKAIREDEDVATALGKNVFWYKLQSLMLGGLCAGVAGALYAWQLTVVFPDNFMPLITFNAWTIVMLGGAGNNVGTILGACIFWGYDSLTRIALQDILPLSDAALGAFRIMVIGLLLIVLMLWRPQGILGKKEELSLGR